MFGAISFVKLFFSLPLELHFITKVTRNIIFKKFFVTGGRSVDFLSPSIFFVSMLEGIYENHALTKLILKNVQYKR